MVGASSGIGCATASALAAAGARVMAAARRIERLRAWQDDIRAAGLEADSRLVDVTDRTRVDRLIAETADRFGGIDIMVYAAGTNIPDRAFEVLKPKTWDMMVATNLTGAFRWIRAASRGMLKARAGRIVNIGSVVGLVGNAGQTNYAAAKAGLIGLTQSVAREFASRGITCNCVCPGFFETDMTSILSDELKSKVLTTIPLSRLGNPKEIAGLVSFLCGPDAGYVTGQAWAMDGGMTM